MPTAFPKLSGTRAQQVAEIADWINANAGNPANLGIGINPGTGASVDLGSEFTAYANAHPNVTAVQAYTAWILTKVGTALPGTISEALTAGANATGTAATAAGAGIASFGA